MHKIINILKKKFVQEFKNLIVNKLFCLATSGKQTELPFLQVILMSFLYIELFSDRRWSWRIYPDTSKPMVNTVGVIKLWNRKTIVGLKF